mgnify:CR=1 FL=1
MPCSDEYWEAVEPVFDLLKQEKNYGTKWSEIADKSQKVYIPLLQAFIDEINRANEKDQTMPRKMIEYLIGIEDYYKVVSKDSKRLTMIHTFNMHDTLNKPAKNKVSAITVPIVKLPTRLVALEFKPGSDNTVEMYLDNGWQLSFRIHMVSLNSRRSSAFLMVSAVVPISLTLCSLRNPASSSSIARFSPAWPPRVGSTLSGFSLRISCSTTSTVSGSI